MYLNCISCRENYLQEQPRNCCYKKHCDSQRKPLMFGLIVLEFWLKLRAEGRSPDERAGCDVAVLSAGEHNRKVLIGGGATFVDGDAETSPWLIWDIWPGGIGIPFLEDSVTSDELGAWKYSGSKLFMLSVSVWTKLHHSIQCLFSGLIKS